MSAQTRGALQEAYERYTEAVAYDTQRACTQALAEVMANLVAHENDARAEAVLDFARHVGPLGDSVKVDTERMARWFIQQQGWPLPAAERTKP